MANIQAPYSESYSSYVSYWRSGLINSSYVFKIPVFADMGEAVILPELSSNNNLNSLTILKYLSFIKYHILYSLYHTNSYYLKL